MLQSVDERIKHEEEVIQLIHLKCKCKKFFDITLLKMSSVCFLSTVPCFVMKAVSIIMCYFLSVLIYFIILCGS